MLSIPGETLEEVLEAVSRDGRFSETERAEAAAIATEYRRFKRECEENLKVEREAGAKGVIWNEPMPAAPFVERKRITDDWFTLRLLPSGKTVFSVKPYTTGRCMNVGVA